MRLPSSLFSLGSDGRSGRRQEKQWDVSLSNRSGRLGWRSVWWMCLDVSRDDASSCTLFSGHRQPVRPVLERRNKGGGEVTKERLMWSAQCHLPKQGGKYSQTENSSHKTLEFGSQPRNEILPPRGEGVTSPLAANCPVSSPMMKEPRDQRSRWGNH